MRIHHLVRGGAVIPLSLAFSLLLASPASACNKAYDDGGTNTTADFDYVDDVAQKTLDGPTVGNPLGGSATLTIYGTSYGCTSNSAAFALTLNGAVIAQFSCNSISGGSGSFSFPAALVQPGVATNTFTLLDIDNTWSTGIYLAVDTNSFYGRSVIKANGGPVNGELRWRLYVPGLVC